MLFYRHMDKGALIVLRTTHGEIGYSTLGLSDEGAFGQDTNCGSSKA